MKELLALQSGISQQARAKAITLGQDACGLHTAGMQWVDDRRNYMSFSEVAENKMGVLPL